MDGGMGEGEWGKRFPDFPLFSFSSVVGGQAIEMEKELWSNILRK